MEKSLQKKNLITNLDVLIPKIFYLLTYLLHCFNFLLLLNMQDFLKTIKIISHKTNNLN